MLKEQRERLPEFLKNLDQISKREGLSKAAEILNVTEGTIKKWFKGKSAGGTEPTSEDFKRHEERVNKYIQKMNDEKVAADAKRAAQIEQSKLNAANHLAEIRQLHLFAKHFVSIAPSLKLMNQLLDSTAFVLSIAHEYQEKELKDMLVDFCDGYERALSEFPEYQDAVDQKEKDRVRSSHEQLALQATEHPKEEDAETAAENNLVEDVLMEEKEQLLEINIAEILPNPYQPRKVFQEDAIAELAASMKKDGLIQPIVVRRTKEGLVLVAGERRMRAAQKLGWIQIKAIVTTMDEAQAAAASIIENFQRVQNNPVEIADAIANMIERTGVTQAEVAKMIGVTQPKIAQIVSLTRLIDPIKDLIAEEKLSPSVGRIIAGLDAAIQGRILSSLTNMTAEKAQQFVNCYKGILEVGEAEESDNLEIRLFQKLFKAGFIDPYASAWNNMNQQGAKTITLKSVKGVYFSSYRFNDPAALENLFTKAGMKQTWSSYQKLVFDLVSGKKDEASEFLVNELRMIAGEKKNEEIENQGVTPEQRAEIARNTLSHLREKFKALLQQAAGTAFEQSIEEAMSDLEGLDDEGEDLNMVEDVLEEAEEKYDALKDMISDTSRARNLNNLKSAFDRADAANSEFADSPYKAALSMLIVKIADVLAKQDKYDSWELQRATMTLCQEVSDTIDAARFSLVSATEEAEEETPVAEATEPGLPVLNQKPEKTKTNRILQILQEQTADLHEISVKCRDCRNFNPDGKTYAERCMGNPSFHQFKRFSIDGKTAFNCSSFAPRRDFIERKKSQANLDMAVAMFELMIYKDGFSREYPHLSWIEDYVPELKGKNLSVQQIVELFTQLDDQSRAYWIEVFFRRNMLNEVVYKNKPHPFYTAEGKRFIVENNSLENEDRI